jgi:type IV secretion system protein VirB4
MHMSVLGDVPDPPSLTYLLSLAGVGIAAAGGLAAGATKAAQEWMFPKYKETRLRDHILFDCVLDDGVTIRCTDGSLLQVISVPGIDLNARSMDEQDSLMQTRRVWLEGLAKWPVGVQVISGRSLHDHAADVDAYENQWLREVQSRWHGSFRRSYRNKHHVVLSVKRGADRAREALCEATTFTVEKLQEYKAEVLVKGSETERSPLLTFWAELLNPCRDVQVGGYSGSAIRKNGNELLYGSMDIRLSDHLCGSEIVFRDALGVMRDDGIASFRDGPDEVWMAGVGVGAWGSVSSAEILQTVMSQDAEMTVSHTVDIIDGAKAKVILEQLMKRSVGAQLGRIQGVDNTIVDQFAQALQLVEAQASNRGMALCVHQLVLFVYGTSRADLEHRVTLVRRAFEAYQVRTSRETASCEPFWFSMFPPHLEWIRGTRMMSANVAHFIELSAPSQGLERCEWGNRPVQLFRTAQGSPYGFTWHVSSGDLALGNVAIFGAAGSGKTVITNFLATSSLGYPNARAFLFDRSDGSYVCTKAFGGTYLDPQTTKSEVGDVCQLNPLHMDLSGESPDRSWAQTWLRDFICQTTDDPESEQFLSDALRRIHGLPLHARTLNTIMESMPANIAAKQQLERWTGTGAYAHLFNATRDSLSFGAERIVTFDVTQVLKDPYVTRALIPYLAYRIESEMQRHGAPWLMGFDETHALLASGPIFREWYLKLLQEIRKQRGVVVSCFQRVGSLEEFGITEAIHVLCPTLVIFPNTQANEAEYCDTLRLTRKEFQIVNKTDPIARQLSRYCLVKREGEGSVILDCDLSPLGDHLNLFQSGSKPANRLRALEREEGNIDRAVERFLGLGAKKRR